MAKKKAAKAKAKRQYTCKTCGQLGHNSRTCGKK